MTTGTRMGMRSLERGVFFAGVAGKGTANETGAGAVCGSSRGATSIASWGMPCWGPCSRHLNSQVCWRICSRDSSRLERVTQESLSPLGHLSRMRSEEHTSELQSHLNLVCRLLLEKKNNT